MSLTDMPCYVVESSGLRLIFVTHRVSHSLLNEPTPSKVSLCVACLVLPKMSRKLSYVVNVSNSQGTL